VISRVCQALAITHLIPIDYSPITRSLPIRWHFRWHFLSGQPSDSVGLHYRHEQQTEIYGAASHRHFCFPLSVFFLNDRPQAPRPRVAHIPLGLSSRL